MFTGAFSGLKTLSGIVTRAYDSRGKYGVKSRLKSYFFLRQKMKLEY
jgi:hypothetical protein